MSEKLCRKNKEADETHGAIAEQIDVAIHRGRNWNAKPSTNASVGDRSQWPDSEEMSWSPLFFA